MKNLLVVTKTSYDEFLEIEYQELDEDRTVFDTSFIISMMLLYLDLDTDIYKEKEQ